MLPEVAEGAGDESGLALDERSKLDMARVTRRPSKAKCCRIALGSGSMPVKRRNAPTAWNTAMPPPSTVRQPFAARHAQQLGLQREVDDLGDPVPDLQQIG